MKKVLFAIILLMLTGCATAPAKLQSNDFVVRNKTFNKSTNILYRDFLEGFRHCNKRFSPDCQNFDGDYRCDIYSKDMYGGRSGWVVGIVNIKTVNKSESIVTIKIQKEYDDPLFGNKGMYAEEMFSYFDKVYKCN